MPSGSVVDTQGPGMLAVQTGEFLRSADEVGELVVGGGVREAKIVLGEVSGGEQRRVLLARAAIARPRLLLLDEATVGLDPASREHLLASVAELVAQQQLSVLWTTHWVQEARHAHALAVLNQGQLLFLDAPAQLLAQTDQTDGEAAFLHLIQGAKSGRERG